jgi:soluble lytic murein transglycosylase-like protein
MLFAGLSQNVQVPIVVGMLLFPAPAMALVDPAVLCQDAARRAAADSGVPYGVLMAIATVESGRDNAPWPWTVNVGGSGQWFDTAEEAANRVDQALLEGATNIDLGCFQLNYRWHASAFSSVDDMLDPVRNAAYAADYLSLQFAKTGDWALAAAAYHSATPEHARVYQDKFETAYSGQSQGSDPIEPAGMPRSNGYRLLVSGAAGQKGSLFPSVSGGRRLIGAP